MRKKSDHVRTNVVIPVPEAILAMHSSVTLCVDIFFADKFIF